MLSSRKIVSMLLLLTACQSSEFYEIPKPASLEFGQNISASSFLSSGTVEEKEWVKIESFDIGRQPLGTVSLFDIGFKNVGNLPAVIRDIQLVGDNADSFFLTHACLKTVESGAMCPISISYKPDTIGKMPSTIKVTFNNGSATNVVQSLPITAAANNLAFLKFESASIDLGSATVGGKVSAFLKVIYNGTTMIVPENPILPARGVIMADPSVTNFTIDRGAQTTCAEVINSDCVIKLDFIPTADEIKNGRIGLTYFNGAEVLRIEAQLVGTGVLGARLAELTASGVDFGSSMVNPATPAGLSIAVNYSGTVAADNVVIVPPAGGMFSISTDPSKTTCGATINGNCAIFVEYKPTASGTHNDTLKIRYSSQGTTRPEVSVSLTGKGVGAAFLKPDVNTLAFGVMPAHKSSTKYFNLTNIGQVAVASLSAIVSSSPEYTAAFESCASLAAAASCRIRVSFVPTTDALVSGNLTFSYQDGKGPVNVTLAMTGTGSSPLVMEGSRTIDFGNVMIGHPVLPSSINSTLGIYGTTLLSTASQLVISAPVLAAPFSYVAASTPGTTSNCRAPINPNTTHSCLFGVMLTTNTGFTADVAVSQAFTIGYTGDAGNGSGTLNFTAKMTPRVPPTLSITAAGPFKTLSVNDSQTVNYTVKNNSPYFATAFKGIAISGNNDFKVAANGCAGGVAANGTCIIAITFKPSDAGAEAAILTYNYHDQIQNQSLVVALNGTGSEDVTLIAQSTTVDFGNVYVGDTISPKDILLNYTGKKVWAGSANAVAPFGLDSSDCGDARNCLLKFSFTPTAAGSFTANVKFDYSPALNSPGTINFTVKGVAQVRSATLALSSLTFPKTMKGENLTQELTLTNQGTLLATDLDVVDPAGIFSLVADASSENCAVKTSLNPGANCKIKVKFSPVKVELTTATLTINFKNNGTDKVLNPVLSGQGTQRLQVFAGAFQTCLINEFGKTICWGRYLPVVKPQNVTPMNLGTNVNVLKIAIGDKHACALLKTSGSDGAVSCWTKTTAPLAVDLNGEVASDLTAGFEHTCALLKSGKVKCWGDNTSGQIGTGLMDFGLKAMGVAAGAGHTCVLLENHAMKCFGDNFYGQLGLGVDTEKLPLQSKNIELGNFTPVAISASSGAFSCAVSDSGSVKCFGKAVGNETATPFYGVLGHCWARASRNSTAVDCPSDLRNASTSIGYYSTDMGEGLAKVDLGAEHVEELSVGTSFSCVLLANKTVKCWGLNLSGQLGIGSVMNVGARQSEMGTALRSVVIDRDVVQIATGYEHACAVLDDNTLKCWGTGLNNATGLNAFGMMTNSGTGSSNTPSLLPVIYNGK